MTRFTVVIPFKGSTAAKSRFSAGDNSDLALAMALDTTEAALGAGLVAGVIVVTSADFVDDFTAIGAPVEVDTAQSLVPAIQLGLDRAGLDTARAVLLGDVPGMSSAELDAALAAAAGFPLSIVADADGSGTVLAIAHAGQAHRLAFGVGSRAAHLAAGYVELHGDWPGLRRDIDVPAHLEGLAFGSRTAASLT